VAVVEHGNCDAFTCAAGGGVMRLGELTSEDAFTAIGGWARSKITEPPWGSGLGLARTLLALGTLATLLATPPQVLMSPVAGGITPPDCDGVLGASVWCIAPHDLAVGRDTGGGGQRLAPQVHRDTALVGVIQPAYLGHRARRW
jgi:hypothetical protein